MVTSTSRTADAGTLPAPRALLAKIFSLRRERGFESAPTLKPVGRSRDRAAEISCAYIAASLAMMILETSRVSVDSELEAPSSPPEFSATPRKASVLQRQPQQRPREGGTASSILEPRFPAARVSLIKASYHAGIKPVAIARTLRVSLSIVNKVLSTEPKARR